MSGWRSQGRLLLLNSLTCGLEICVAAGITYVPPLLLEAGVEERYMTMVLGIGPVLGLLFIPLIGSASDQCNSSYGRRRPFIWLLSLGVLLALFIIPNADLLAARLPWAEQTLQVGFLILGVGLLDFCGQVCFTPLEALLSDLYRDEEDCGRAFAMFSFMVSVGGCVGYLLPAVDWSRSPLAVYLGGQAECLFSLLILIFVTSVIVTMKVSEEPSCSGPARSGPLPEPGGGGAREAGRCGLPRSCFSLLRCKLRLLGAGPLLCLLRTCRTTIPAIFWSYCRVPRVIRQLCAAQLCSWMAVMSFMLFYTDFVGEGLYGGVPSAAPGSVARQRYDEGIRIGSLGLFLQCSTSTMFSLAMSRLLRRFGPRRVYLGSMVSFTLSALGICLSGSVVMVTAMTALTGFAYATLQTVPYTLTCHYHKEKEVYLSPGKPRTSHSNGVAAGQDALYLTPAEEEGGVQNHKPPLYRQDGLEYFPLQQGEAGGERRGVGLDFAILDSTFLLSQVIPTLFMGAVVQLARSVTAYIASSALFGAVAIYLSTRIVFDQKDLRS